MDRYMVVSFGVRVEKFFTDSKNDAQARYNDVLKSREVYMAQMFSRHGHGAWEVVRFGHPKHADWRIEVDGEEGTHNVVYYYAFEEAVNEYDRLRREGRNPSADEEVVKAADGAKLPLYQVTSDGIVELETYCEESAKREYNMLIAAGEDDVEVTKNSITIAKSATNWFN